MHEHSPDHACGENELQIPDFASYQWEWMANVPRFRDHYLATTRPRTTGTCATCSALIAHQFPGEQRWMLKSNQHSEQLGPLLATYPDATVVMIHRDPVATLRSLLTMRGLAFKSSQKKPDIDTHVEYWVDAHRADAAQAYMRDRIWCPTSQLVEVMFADIVEDDVQRCRRGARAGRPAGDRRVHRRHRGLHGLAPRGKDGRVVYDLEGDFGLDADELRDRFAFYTDAFDIRPET